MYVAGLTDTGFVRTQNQDIIFYINEPIGPLPNLFVVADGMGGHKAGDVASKLAVDLSVDYIRHYAVPDFIEPENFLDLLINAGRHANQGILDAAAENPEYDGMGTTLILSTIYEHKMYIAHIGDSRVYAVNDCEIKQITVDHSYVEQLVKAGEVSEDDAHKHPKRSMLTRVMGVPMEYCEFDGLILDVSGYNSVLLCSDGLTNMMNDDAIKGIVNGIGFVENRVKALIEEANAHGGVDNISVIIIDIKR